MLQTQYAQSYTAQIDAKGYQKNAKKHNQISINSLCLHSLHADSCLERAHNMHV